MCLEDLLIVALFAYPGGVSGAVIADQLGISETALYSIINRVNKSQPNIITNRGFGEDLILYPNKAVENDVQAFLAEGGFTAINESDWRKYKQASVIIEAKKILVWVAVSAAVITLLIYRSYYRRRINDGAFK